MQFFFFLRREERAASSELVSRRWRTNGEYSVSFGLGSSASTIQNFLSGEQCSSFWLAFAPMSRAQMIFCELMSAVLETDSSGNRTDVASPYKMPRSVKVWWKNDEHGRGGIKRCVSQCLSLYDFVHVRFL